MTDPEQPAGAAAPPDDARDPAPAPDRSGRRLPPTGLGDLVDVVRVLDLQGAEIATAAELLRLRPRALKAVAPPVRRAPGATPRPREVAAGPAGAVGGEVPTEALPPSLPAVAVETPAERTALPLAPRSLAELLPVGGPAPPPEGLFRPGTRRALLRGIGAVREREGDIDIEAVIELLAGNRALDVVPLEWVDTTRGEVLLLLDGGEAMEPYRGDLDRLPGELARVVGPDVLTVRWFEDCPTGPAGVLRPGDYEPRPFELPPARTRLLAVTAFGVRGTQGASPGLVREWRRLAARCRRRGVPLLVLTPLPVKRHPPAISAVTWDRATSVRDVLRAERAAR